MLPEEILLKFGLSSNEARLYLELLKSGQTIVRNLSLKTGFNRTTIYVVLDSLIKKGLVNITSATGIKRYTAVSPEVLVNHSKKMIEKYSSVRNSLERSIVELSTLYSTSKHKPKVRLLEGRDGLIEAFEDTLKSKNTLVRISSSVGDIFQTLPWYLPEYVSKRFSRNIKMRGIHPLDYAAIEMMRHHPNINFDDIALVPTESLKLPADVAIYDNKVGLMSTKEMFAIIIESNEISEMFRKLFDQAYITAEKLQTKKQ